MGTAQCASTTSVCEHFHIGPKGLLFGSAAKFRSPRDGLTVRCATICTQPFLKLGAFGKGPGLATGRSERKF
jgi:hypothetical protein